MYIIVNAESKYGNKINKYVMVHLRYVFGYCQYIMYGLRFIIRSKYNNTSEYYCKPTQQITKNILFILDYGIY